MAAFPLRDVEPIIPPIHIVERQRGDFASAEAIRDQQPEDRVITTADDRPARASVGPPPTSPHAESRTAMGLGRADRSTQILRDVPLPTEIAQEDA